MSQSLIVNQTYKNVDFQLSSINSAVHGLVSIVVKSFVEKLGAEIVDDIIVFIGLKLLVLEAFSIKGD